MTPVPQNLRRDLECALVIVGAGLLAYANHLHNPFQFDSVRFIQENRQFADPAQMMTWRFFIQNYATRSGLFWSYALNARLHGLDPFGFHLVNLAFHLMNGLLVFLVTRQACRYFRLPLETAGERPVALATALLFLLHPIQTESVIYIMSRSELMAGWCYLLAFYSFQRALDRDRPAGFGFRCVTVPLAALFALGVGYSIKPTVATLPAAMALYYLLGREPNDPVRAWIRRWKWPLAAALALAGGGLVYQLAADPSFLSGSPLAVKQIGRQTYVLTQPWVVVFHYLKLMLFPFNLNIDPDIPRAAHPGSGYFIAGVAALAVWIGLAARARRCRLYLFATLWYLLVLSPSSSFVTLLDLAAEHRVYLACWGVCLLMVVGVVRLAGWLRTPAVRSRAVAAVLVLLLFTAGVLTARRNTVWADELTLWQDALEKSPHKLRPLVNLGRAYTLAGDVPRAIELYERSLATGGHFFQTHYNLGVLYLEQNKEDAALEHFQIAVALDPTVPDVHGRLGDLYMRRREWYKADAHLKRAVELNPQYASAFRGLGLLHYFHLNDRRGGRHFFSRSLFLAPDQPDAEQLRQLIAAEPTR